MSDIFVDRFMTSESVVRRKVHDATKAWAYICKSLSDGELVMKCLYLGVQQGMESELDRAAKDRQELIPPNTALTSPIPVDVYDARAYTTGHQIGSGIIRNLATSPRGG